jgi:hypothetical protein
MMKNIFGIVLAVCLYLFTSCCNEHDDNSGMIMSDFHVGDFSQGYDCFNLPDTICIRDDSTYQKVFKTETTKSSCAGLSLPLIDFNKNSILIYQKGGGLEYYHRQVQIDTVGKIVIYSISTTRCFCPDKCSRANQNMVIVPKIGKDYKVQFK